MFWCVPLLWFSANFIDSYLGRRPSLWLFSASPRTLKAFYISWCCPSPFIWNTRHTHPKSNPLSCATIPLVCVIKSSQRVWIVWPKTYIWVIDTSTSHLDVESCLSWLFVLGCVIQRYYICASLLCLSIIVNNLEVYCYYIHSGVTTTSHGTWPHFWGFSYLASSMFIWDTHHCVTLVPGYRWSMMKMSTPGST